MRFIVVPVCLILLVSFSQTDADAQQLRARDLALKVGFQDTTFGHYKRGRACVAADFNLDGYVDFYVGNPGDESFILENVSGGGAGARRFVQHPLPLDGELTWGGVSFDYDNDGDYDLFVSIGGSEGIGFDFLFKNEWIETGELQFTDVSEVAGIKGFVPDGESDPIMSASANAVTADYDLDGDTDLFVNGNKKTIPGYGQYEGRNTLWRNNGNGTFTDVTIGAGLGDYLHATRHSTFFDFDNDGDPDLYENNFFGCNVLWKNNGDGTFTDVTVEMSAPGEDLTDPTSSFATASADFNNDGWEDLIVFMRGRGRPEGRRITGICDCSGCGDEFPFENVDCDGYDQYPMGHALYMNQQGTGFVNVADIAGINNDYVEAEGVMGCQIGDINGDGTPDIYVGNGGPSAGQHDRFYVSTSGFGADIPTYANETAIIDVASQIPGTLTAPPYPYRTHGIAFVDVDNNGTVEVAVINGGPVSEPDIVREPNRLFTFRTATPFNWLKVRPVGNALTVSKDAVGTRITVNASNPPGEQRIVRKTLFAGSAFSGQNGFEVYFGLGETSVVESITLDWPDGTTTVLTENLPINASVVVEMDPQRNARITSVTLSTETEAISSEQRVGDSEDLAVGQNYPNPFNPTTLIRYELTHEGHVTVEIFNVLGERIRLLADQVESPGSKVVEWDGKNSVGQPVSSGLYLYKVSTGTDVVVKKMLLSK